MSVQFGIGGQVTQRTAGTDLLFHENDDYLEFLGRMKDVAENYKLEIISFVCMPNPARLACLPIMH